MSDFENAVPNESGKRQLKRKVLARRIAGKTVNYLGLIIVSLFFLFPFFFMLFKAMMGNQESIGVPDVHFLPTEWHFEYFAKALDEDMLLWFKNTLIVVVCNCISVPFMSALCAFGFSRLKFKTRNFWFYATLATMMLPSTVTQVPLYSLFYHLNLLGSIRALIVPNIFGGGAMNIFLMRQYMRSIPSALDEAATIDGASKISHIPCNSFACLHADPHLYDDQCVFGQLERFFFAADLCKFGRFVYPRARHL